MAFWSTETIKARQLTDELIRPYNEDRVQQGAYELTMGAQAAISCDGANRIARLAPSEEFCIPRGQFALLLTEERVKLPSDAMGFISIKTKYKSRGLVNVSGFHVDPGFACRLKFWVYNAGNEDIHVQRGMELFLMWISELDRKTDDIYKKNSLAHDEITAEDLRNLHGTLASPAALAKKIEELEGKVRLVEWIGGTALVILVALCAALATPLLDYIIKPVVERFAKANPPIVRVPASPPASPPDARPPGPPVFTLPSKMMNTPVAPAPTPPAPAQP